MTDLINIKNRLLNLDSASISDAMDSLNIFGALYNIKAQVNNIKIVGPIFTVKYESFIRNNSKFYNAGNYIDSVPDGSIIIIDNNAREDCTNWGDILTEVAISKGIVGTIINGSVRDINFIRKKNYPLFSAAITMVSGKNRVKMVSTQTILNINGVAVYPNDRVLADDNGVIVIPQTHVEEVIIRAENVERTENLIRKAIIQGLSLQEARKKFNYSEPWAQK
ncbi:MAG: RraA family protein [Solitalea-like symbiont of Acarus siro]